MSRIKARDTKPELFVRSLLHKLGFRFRLNYNKVPGKPDIAFPKEKKAIFINGCFWHGHKGCDRASCPRTNKTFWNNKIKINILRDKKVIKELNNIGWKVLTLWQCEIKSTKKLDKRLKSFMKKDIRMGARDKIRKFFIANVGKIVTTKTIRRVAGISEYARRIRELRDEEGFQIKSHIDRADMKPGQYILETVHRKPVISRTISPQLRLEILERNGYTCQICGACPEDTDPFNSSRKIRLHIDHKKPISQGGTDTKENLRVLCSACNQGKSNIQAPTETAINVIAKIRKLAKSDQKQVFEFLKRKFENK